jgi:hypothetical protein
MTDFEEVTKDLKSCGNSVVDNPYPHERRAHFYAVVAKEESAAAFLFKPFEGQRAPTHHLVYQWLPDLQSILAVCEHHHT